MAKIVLLLVAMISSCAAQVAEEHLRDCTVLSRPGTYPDYDPLPSYNIERREYDASKPPALDLRISMPTRAFGGAAIIRLGCKLISDFPHETRIHAWLFDDKGSARRLAPMFTDQRDYGIFLWHLKGRFELDRGNNKAFIEFLLPEYREGLLSVRRIRYTLLSDQQGKRTQ
jgi:hypothetical protein